MAVVAGRHEHPRGREPVDRRRNHIVHGPQEHVSRRSLGKRDVDRHAGCKRATGLGRDATERPVAGELAGYEQHPWVVPEDGLGAVSVMHVPIHDEHALAPCRQRSRRDGHVVEQAEAHGPVGEGVMAGRTNDNEPTLSPFRVDLVDDGEPSAGSAQRRVPGTRTHTGVGVEPTAAAAAEPVEPVEVVDRMHPFELVPLGRPRLDGADRLRDARIGNARHCRAKPFGSLGMIPTTVMAVDVERGGHGEHPPMVRRSRHPGNQAKTSHGFGGRSAVRYANPSPMGGETGSASVTVWTRWHCRSRAPIVRR